jgi:hypothetical protein
MERAQTALGSRQQVEGLRLTLMRMRTWGMHQIGRGEQHLPGTGADDAQYKEGDGTGMETWDGDMDGGCGGTLGYSQGGSLAEVQDGRDGNGVSECRRGQCRADARGSRPFMYGCNACRRIDSADGRWACPWPLGWVPAGGGLGGRVRVRVLLCGVGHERVALFKRRWEGGKWQQTARRGQI